LYKWVSLPPMMVYGNNVNSDFADAVFGASNAYLSFSVWTEAENLLYTCSAFYHVSNVIESFCVEEHSENIFASKSIQKSFNIFYSKYITSSSNIWFSTNLIGCSECLFCDWLQNQTYCIRNTQYEKDEYLQKKQELLSHKESYSTWAVENNAEALNYNSQNCTWSLLVNCTDIEQWYLCRDMSVWRNLFIASGGEWWSTNFYDWFDVWLQCDNFYAVAWAWNTSSHIYCCANVNNSSHIYYSIFVSDCSFCLWCIGLKNKSYCIFNKQYTKEDRYAKVDEIFSQMDKNGTLWQFFPASMNPFYFNDTAACLIDPSFTKEEIKPLWYMRRDEPIKADIPDRMETVKTTDLSKYEWYKEWERTIDPSILKKVIIDDEGNSYRVVKLEYDFLVKHGLPLPRKHWLERMKDNFRL
jgi:hypothetical protein